MSSEAALFARLYENSYETGGFKIRGMHGRRSENPKRIYFQKREEP